eukprot:493727_1
MSRLITRRGGNVWLFADCCYSGNWVKKLQGLEGKVKNVIIFAASIPNEKSLTLYTIQKEFVGSVGTSDWKKIIREVINQVAYGNKPDLSVDNLVFGCLGMIDGNGKYNYHENKNVMELKKKKT